MGIRSNRGFTLLELIVAFTILALLGGMVFSSLRIAVNSYDKSQERIEEAARRRVLFDQVKRQIGSLYPLRPTAGFQLQDLDAGMIDPVQQMAMAQAPLFYGDQDSVTFVTVAPLLLQENPGLAVTRYGRAEDEFGIKYLGAMESRYTGLESFLYMMGDPSGKPLPLVEEVEALEFSYYGWDTDMQQYSWFPEWIGEERLTVPEAIRIAFDESYVIIPVNAQSLDFQGRLMNPTVGF